MDPYECVCEYIWAMRRLLTLVSSQNHCTDTVCFTEYPGYEGSSTDDSGGVQMMLLLALYLLVVVVLFMFRPRSMRSSRTDWKPTLRLHQDKNGSGPPPPPPSSST